MKNNEDVSGVEKNTSPLGKEELEKAQIAACQLLWVMVINQLLEDLQWAYAQHAPSNWKNPQSQTKNLKREHAESCAQEVYKLIWGDSDADKADREELCLLANVSVKRLQEAGLRRLKVRIESGKNDIEDTFGVLKGENNALSDEDPEVWSRGRNPRAKKHWDRRGRRPEDDAPQIFGEQGLQKSIKRAEVAELEAKRISTGNKIIAHYSLYPETGDDGFEELDEILSIRNGRDEEEE